MQRFSHRHGVFCCALLGSVTLWVCVLAPVADGAVPASLQQRTQDASAESLLAALEAKAQAAGDGSWSISSGRQNVAATAYQSGTAASAWYLRPAGDGAGGSAGAGIFSDGQTFYQDRQRWYLDSIEQGRRMDYLLGPYLLHVNLRPRQFLGVHPLKNSGEVMVGEAKYIRLHADLRRDAATRADAYASKGRRINAIDYYYDPAHAAIGRVVVRLSDGAKLVATVAEWDKFGTNGDWPMKLSGRQQDPKVGEPVLTTIESFTPGKDDGVAEAAKAVESTAFFGGIAEDLRKPETYAVGASLTDLIFAAQASFVSGEAKAGLERWDQLQQQLAAEGQKSLEGLLVPAALASLTQNPPVAVSQRDARIALIKRLTSDITPQQWLGRSSQLAMGWVRLQIEGGGAEVEALDEMMIRNIAAHGNHQALRVLLNYLGKDKKLAAKADPILQEVVGAPLPASGYGGTRQSSIIGICITEQQTTRARELVAALRWDDATPAAAKAPVELIQGLLDAHKQLRDPAVGAKLLELYNRAEDESIDSVTRNTSRAYALQLAALAVRSSGWTKEGGTPPAAYLTASASQPNADRFWDNIIAGLLTIRADDLKVGNGVIKCASELAAAYEEQLKQPGYLSRIWLKIGTSRNFHSRIFSPATRVQYLNKAFATAVDDAGKLEAMRAIALALTRAAQYAEAIQALEGMRQALAASAHAAVDGAIADVRDAQKRHEERIAQQQKQVNVDRIKGQLAYLQTQLEEAKKLQGQQKKVDDIQKLVEQTKSELDAATAAAAAAAANQ